MDCGARGRRLLTEGGPSFAVSVITPARNAEVWLRETARALAAASGEAVDWIVVDDASVDGTAAVALRAGARLLPGLSKGPSVARNTGILASTTEFVLFLDADDLYLEGAIDTLLDAARNSPEGDVYYCGRTDVDAGSHIVGAINPRPLGDCPFHSLLTANSIPTNGGLVRRSALARSGIFDPEISRCEDWALWLRLAATGAVFVRVEGALAVYRDTPGSLSKTWRPMWFGCKSALRVAGPPGHKLCWRCMVNRRKGRRDCGKYLYYRAIRQYLAFPVSGGLRAFIGRSYEVIRVCPPILPLVLGDLVRAAWRRARQRGGVKP